VSEISQPSSCITGSREWMNDPRNFSTEHSGFKCACWKTSCCDWYSLMTLVDLFTQVVRRFRLGHDRFHILNNWLLHQANKLSMIHKKIWLENFVYWLELFCLLCFQTLVMHTKHVRFIIFLFCVYSSIFDGIIFIPVDCLQCGS